MPRLTSPEPANPREENGSLAMTDSVSLVYVGV
jgi:hypothetical protein